MRFHETAFQPPPIRPQSSSMNTPAAAHPKSLIVIPARLASTRLPRKLLLRETGKTLIQHTYEAALKATLPAGVIVATDHEEIFHEVKSFGGRAIMTSPTCASGTDRVAEIARRMPETDILVNVQGDEPEIAGESIDLAIRMLDENPDAVMSTLATPICSREQLDDPACVKVVCDVRGRAMYFSRSPIPHPRQWDDALQTATPPNFFQHVGLYAYRRDFLLRLAEMPPSKFEQIEKLEQLRVLEAGHSILVGIIDDRTFGIDTPEDYRRFVEKWRAVRDQ
jgi:3-deoxy-manno-octulosonate cytidylyltransferase (CMP-KDO synthetase)